MPLPCSVCAHPELRAIDADLTAKTKSRKAIAFAYRISEGAISRHTKHRMIAAGKVLAGRSVRAALAAGQGPRQAVEAILSGSAMIGEITRLRQRADSFMAQAEASSDYRTSLLAIRELTRLLELQGRLAIEAQQGRASDVSSHPVWLSLASDIMSSLAPWPDAARAVAQCMRARLGIVVAEPTEPFPL